MAGIDNTTYFYILKKLSGKKNVAICNDLYLFDKWTEFLPNGHSQGGKHYTYWPNREAWRGKVSSEYNFYGLDDPNKVACQVFRDDEYSEKEFCFNSHAYDVLLRYIDDKFPLNNRLETLKSFICDCFADYRLDYSFSDKVNEMNSVEELAKYIVSQASDCMSSRDRVPQKRKITVGTTPPSPAERPTLSVPPSSDTPVFVDPPAPPQRKRIFLILSVVFMLFFAFLAVFIVLEEKKELQYDPKTMYSITLYPSADMSLIDFNSSADAIKHRCDVLTGGVRYGFEKTDDNIKLILPKKIFRDLKPETVLNSYVVAPTELYLLDEAKFSETEFASETYCRLGRSDIDEICIYKGGDIAEEVEFSEEDKTQPFLKLSLTEAGAARVSKKTAGWGAVILAQDITQSGWGYWTSYMDTEGTALYIIVDEGLSELIAYNYSNAPISSDVFEVEIHHEIEWEKCKEAFYPGDRQRDVDQLRGALVQLRFSSHMEKKKDGDWVDSELGLKARLDRLNTEYAYGTVVEDGYLSAVVRISPQCLGAPVLKLLTSNNDSLRLVSGMNVQQMDEYTTETRIETNSFGEIIYRVAFTDSVSDYWDLLANGTELILYAGDVPLLSNQMTNSVSASAWKEDRSIEFSQLYYNRHQPLKQENAWILGLIDEILYGEYTVDFAVSSYDYVGDDVNAGFGIDCEEDKERVKEALNTVVADADFAISDLSPWDVKVFLSMDVDASLPRTAAETVQKIYDSIDFENSAFSSLSLYLIDEDNSMGERARFFFQKDYDEKQVELRYHFENGRLEGYKDTFEALFLQTEFVSGLHLK